MKKSELQSLIKETIDEMFDPLQGVRSPKSTSQFDPVTKKQVDGFMSSLQKAHSALVKAINSKYGSQYKNIEVYIKVGSDGVPSVEVVGFSKDGSSGDLSIKYPETKSGRSQDYIRKW